MVKNDLGYKRQNMGGEKVLFHKVIFHSYEEAINILKSRNLAPGELAVARYYVGYDDTTIPPSWDYIRMVLAIGGATPNSNDDTYFFKDFTDKNSNEGVTFDDLEEKLSNYYTKEEIDEILKGLVPEKVDLSNYYDKSEIDEKFDKIVIPDVSNFVKKEELDKKVDVSIYQEEINKKANVDSVDASIKSIEDKIESKVDSSFVESYFNDNVLGAVESAINDANISNIVAEAISEQDIEGLVSSAIDKKLENVEGVTTETIDTVLENNEYFNESVITPIITIEDKIKEIENKLIGEEEEEWEI